MSVEAPSDAAELAALGYQQELPRLLRFWSNFAIGFAFISPIVGMYTVAALEIETVGAAWIWAVLVVAIGQLVVALVFAELGAKWPIAGGVYQWARRLLGPKFGWWTGWIYIWSMVATLSVIAYAGGGYLGELLGISSPSTATSIELALVVMAIYTFVNAIGLHLLRFIVNLGITAEIIATLFLGTLLVLFFRHHSPSVLVHNQGAVHPGKAVPAAFAALAYGGWVLFGFDACGAIAEETQNPKQRVPRATIWSLAVVGVIDLIVIAGLMLSQPDLKGAVSGTVADPISAPVTAALGSWSTKPFLAIVVIGFISCGIAVQAASVRIIYSFARDDMLPLSRLWRRVTAKSSVPMYAVIGTGILASLIFLYGKVLAVLVGFATGAIYLSYFAAVAGLVYLKARKRWQVDPTRFNLGRAGFVISIVAATWLIFEFINIAWPRTASLPWYENWAMVVGTVILGAVGGVYYLVTRPDRKLAATGVAEDPLNATLVGDEASVTNRPPGTVEPHAENESLV
jgi:amino acid transporter